MVFRVKKKGKKFHVQARVLWIWWRTLWRWTGQEYDKAIFDYRIEAQAYKAKAEFEWS